MAPLPLYRIQDYHFASIADAVERSYFSVGQDSVAVEGSYLAPGRGRISALTMDVDVAATLELYINNQPQFVSGNPTVDLQTYQNPRYYTYNRGDVIKVAKTAGLGVGTVSLDTETHQLLKRDEVVAVPARERLTRALQRGSYLPQPHRSIRLTQGWATAREAASGIADRGTKTGAGTGSSASASQVNRAWSYGWVERHGGERSDGRPTPTPRPDRGIGSGWGGGGRY